MVGRKGVSPGRHFCSPLIWRNEATDSRNRSSLAAGTGLGCGGGGLGVQECATLDAAHLLLVGVGHG